MSNQSEQYIVICEDHLGNDRRYFTRKNWQGQLMFGGSLMWDSAKKMTKEEAQAIRDEAAGSITTRQVKVVPASKA